jgi:hypothetical protein
MTNPSVSVVIPLFDTLFKNFLSRVYDGPAQSLLDVVFRTRGVQLDESPSA